MLLPQFEGDARWELRDVLNYKRGTAKYLPGIGFYRTLTLMFHEVGKETKCISVYSFFASRAFIPSALINLQIMRLTRPSCSLDILVY